jgi:sugar lactone lactonase YvrE
MAVSVDLMRARGGVLMALERGLYGFDPASGALEHLHDPEPDKPDNRCNDGTTDPRGRLMIGTMRKQELGMRREGTLYRFDPDHSCRVIERDIWVPNGLAFSPDGRTMYFSDSYVEVRTIWAYDYDLDTGTPSNKRVFVDTHGMPGRPDGGAMDADGCYWMSGVSGWQLVRFTPAGKVDRIIDMPVERPSKIAFGGPRLDTMYVTSIRAGLTPGSEPRQPNAGCLFAIAAGVTGIEVAPFAG